MLDSSVLVGIIRGEPDVRGLLDVLESEECAIGAPTLVEARLWCSVNLTKHLSEWLEHLLIRAGNGCSLQPGNGRPSSLSDWGLA